MSNASCGSSRRGEEGAAVSKDWPFSKESVGGRAIALEDFDFLQIDHDQEH
jgi:hypothetical protein